MILEQMTGFVRLVLSSKTGSQSLFYSQKLRQLQSECDV